MAAHWKKRETLFAEYGVEITLPGAWQHRPDGDATHWHYRSADKRETLTIARQEQTDSDDVALRQAVARHRRAVELGFSRTGVEISEPEEREEGGIVFCGGSGADHFFHALVLCMQESVWTLFYESHRLSEETAHEHAHAIWASVREGRRFR